MKFLKSILVLTFLIPLTGVKAGAPDKKSTDLKKVLMVVSGYGEDEGETLPGYEFDEFSKAFLIFKANGVSVDIASPKGGPVVADKFNSEKSNNAKVLADKDVMSKLANTMATSMVKASQYQGIFIVGGKGAMFDLTKDKSLRQLVADVYENQGSVSAVCHGPAALADVKLSNGSYLVKGKKINGFTNMEEKAFGKKWVSKFEFLIEDRMKERGAIFESSPMMMSHTTVDKRIITGQNPFSTADTAEALVKSMGLVPVKREEFKDDRTIKLVARIYSGEKVAEKEFVNNVEHYQSELVAVYGYYSMQYSDSDSALLKAINLMELASPYMKNPQLDMAIAQGFIKLKDTANATIVLKKLLQDDPELEAAQKMLDTIKKS